MGERAVIEASDAPRTRASLTADLRALGVREGEVLLVHASLSSLGWVCGGALAVVQALRDALGPSGTLVVPTHTAGNSDPATWGHPPVPRAWWPAVREQLPGFDPQVTPSSGMGALAEVARTLPDALRSAHPQCSFAAAGPEAATITADHALQSGMGEESPLARLYDLGAGILLLGAGHANNSSFHLAEYRVPSPSRAQAGAAILTPRGRAWVTFEDVDLDSGDFEELGTAFDATGAARIGRVGSAPSRLMSQRAAVDFATAWLSRRRRSRT